MVDELDLTACSDALVDSVTTRRRQEAARMALIAHWVDLHAPTDAAGRWGAPTPAMVAGAVDATDATDATDAAGQERGGSATDSEVARLRRSRTAGKRGGRGIQLGGEGTPRVSEFAVTELGVLLEIGTVAAANRVREVLDLRHRLPPVWAGVMAGDIEPWQAGKAAAMTRPLTLGQVHAVADQVADQVADALASLPFGRAVTAIEAAVIAADPAAHHTRMKERASRRFVGRGRAESLSGLQTLILHGTGEEVARVEAMVDHLAAALGRLGDPDTVESRRVKALVLMAHPAQACLVLARAYPTPQRLDQQQPPEPLPAEEEESAGITPLGMAVLFGRLLAEGGTTVIERLRPKTVLYLHLAEDTLHAEVTGHQPPGGPDGTGEPIGVVRVQDLGPATLHELRTWLTHDRIEVRPVLDVATMVPVDSYEVPARMRQAMECREPFEVFPFGATPAHRADQDHTIPSVEPEDGGPPGQTQPANLGPLSRHHHRAKTHGGFTCHQPLPGLYLWRTPSGHWYRRDHTGSHHLGRRTPDVIRQAQRLHHLPPRAVHGVFLNMTVDTSELQAGR